jgi:transposase InsO family protein
VRFAFIRVEKALYPVSVLCDALGVRRSGYYAYVKRPPSARRSDDARLVAEIRRIHERSRKYRSYGSPRVHRELVARGEEVGRHRVARLMREHGIVARRRRRFVRTTDSNHRLPVAPNLLDRQFEASGPNQVWVTDITYVWTSVGWLYVAAILDLFSRRVVGLASSDRIDRHLVLAALDEALQTRQPPRGLLHHSDRGSQYASAEYREALRARGITASMSRRGDCWDNAVAESFFSTLKVELVHHERFASRAEAATAIREYVERFYNVERRHSSLNYVSPMEFELMAQTVSLAA